MFAIRDHVDEGGLISYGPSFPALFQRAATYIDKILKGASLGLGLLRFPRRQPGENGLTCQAGPRGPRRSPMSSWDEEMVTMMGGLAAVAVFCIATLLWLM